MKFYSASKKPIHIFYHVYQVKNWEMLYQEQIHNLWISGLMKECEKLHIGVVGNIPLFYVPDKAEVIYHEGNNAESDTMIMIRDFCVINPNVNVMYLHTKGVTYNDINSNSWRLFMEYFVIHKWKECIDFLKDYDCCGPNWTIETNMGTYPHFSGGLWWATSEYITTLDSNYIDVSDVKVEGFERYRREFWIGSNYFVNNPKVKDLWSSGLNYSGWALHYYRIYPEEKYIL